MGLVCEPTDPDTVACERCRMNKHGVFKAVYAHIKSCKGKCDRCEEKGLRCRVPMHGGKPGACLYCMDEGVVCQGGNAAGTVGSMEAGPSEEPEPAL